MAAIGSQRDEARRITANIAKLPAAAPIMARDHDAQVKTVMREPTRKCQKEWSFEPPTTNIVSGFISHEQCSSVRAGRVVPRVVIPPGKDPYAVRFEAKPPG